MKHDDTIAEVEGGKSAAHLASSDAALGGSVDVRGVDARSVGHSTSGNSTGGAGTHVVVGPRELARGLEDVGDVSSAKAEHGPSRAGSSGAVRADAGSTELRVIAGGTAPAEERSAGREGEDFEEKDRADAEQRQEEASRRRARVRGAEDAVEARAKKPTNNLRKLRIERMMSKAELARRANLSVLTIDRIEKGFGCRMDSKRKILEALGLSLADRVRVFGEEE